MNERSWNILSIAAVVAAGLILLWHVLAPMPSAGKVVQARANQERQLRETLKSLRARVTETRSSNESRIWTEPADEVGAAAMAYVSSLAQSKGMKVIAFRPQRPEKDVGVMRHPFMVSLEGSFPSIVSFLNSVETGKGKLAVNTVQIAAADGATDKVSASIGVVAYRELENNAR